MTKIILDEDYIKSLPITTNKIEVNWDAEKFFSKYSIVSYRSDDPKLRNLAYEQLADVPCLSVTGIRARWKGQRYSSIKFFILTEKGKEQEVLNSLRNYGTIIFSTDTLKAYDALLQKRIIASLAINSLGKKKKGRMMYNDGSLLVCDDKNFNIKKSRKELVCLKIEINEYMILTAKTTSFSNPHSDNELRKYKNCVFQVAKDINGDFWSGQAVKPIVIKNLSDGDYDLKKMYIQKKNFKDNKNNVPYWPYTPENYPHGKLYVIWQVIESVNEAFEGIIEVNFADFHVEKYEERKTGDDMLSLLQNYLAGKSIYIEDSFQTPGSKELIKQFENEAQNILNVDLIISKKATKEDLIIKLCEPIENDYEDSFYTQSLDRFSRSGNALQHMVYHNDPKNDVIESAYVRRILIELVVKDCIIKRKMPKELSRLLEGWNFIQYKINQGNVHGALLCVNSDGIMDFEQYGLSQSYSGVDFEDFVWDKLKYDDPSKLRGARDYRVLVKNDNVYLIIDTDEIPILDVSKIDDAYDLIVNQGVTVSMFKRKAVAHEYLRGYIGFHMWKTDGIDGEAEGSYSYISGTNIEKMKITHTTKMDKMPHARRIFILNTEHPEMVDDDMEEIAEMLKWGFGRWDEMMTYPFPFKFLYEYLDDATETAFSIHWNEITYNKDL